ncbi:uncharacterized protein LOC127753486 [Oryza glaberrima]|uniref:uncharacterized protein LOC127753486 n=1 Tax=Oryza glaberrima TaxID=4538 RepID=UPI00224C2ECC|nr:uncharacterized protein LOC127753486 [Oryza glaberrima]
MGMLGLARIMSMKRRRRRRRRRIQADGSSALDMGRKDSRSRSGSAKRRGPHLTLDRLPQVEESAKEPYPLVINPKYLKNHLLPEHCHQSIKHVTVTGFCHTQELVELIFYILENATSLQCLTLDNRIRGFEDLVACITQDAGTRDYQ